MGHQTNTGRRIWFSPLTVFIEATRIPGYLTGNQPQKPSVQILLHLENPSQNLGCPQIPC